jgi:DNA-binding transcriptional MerR regulator
MDELGLEEDLLLTPGQARRLCGDVAVSTWGRWVKQELIKAAHRTLGGHRRFRVSDVRAFRATLTQTGVRPAEA